MKHERSAKPRSGQPGVGRGENSHPNRPTRTRPAGQKGALLRRLLLQQHPNISQDGRNLKQACVAQRLGELDEILQKRSPYKPEVSYDMTKNPPQPILDSQTGSSPHGWIPGWIRKYWDEDPEHPPFKPGKGMIRRPDVVIVKDPTKPPTRDNIKQVVEMKFPPDPASNEQKDAYAEITQDDQKVVVLKATECDCNQQEQETKISTKELGWAATVAGAIMFIITRGKSRIPQTIPAY